MPYATPRDLAPIAQTLSGPSIITVQPKLGIKTGEDLVAYLKTNPGKLNLGSHGIGSFSHIAMEMFMAETGTTPSKAVERLRIEVARQRVQSSSEAIERVAENTGFRDPERMRRAFIRAFGQPPQSLRRAARAG